MAAQKSLACASLNPTSTNAPTRLVISYRTESSDNIQIRQPPHGHVIVPLTAWSSDPFLIDNTYMVKLN